MVDRIRRPVTEEERRRRAERTAARTDPALDDIPALPTAEEAAPGNLDRTMTSRRRAEFYGAEARKYRREASPIRSRLREMNEAARDFLDPRRAEGAGPDNLWNNLPGAGGSASTAIGIRALGRAASPAVASVPAPVVTVPTALGVAGTAMSGSGDEEEQREANTRSMPEVPGGRVLRSDEESRDLSGVTGVEGDFIRGRGVQAQTAGPFGEGYYDIPGLEQSQQRGGRQSIRERTTLPVGQSARNDVLEAYGLRGVGRGALARIEGQNRIRREGLEGQFSRDLTAAVEQDNRRLADINNRGEERRQFDKTLGETQRQFDVETINTLRNAQRETGLPPEDFDSLVGGALNKFERFTGIQSDDPEVRGQMRERMAERFGNYTREAQQYIESTLGPDVAPEVLRRTQQNLIDGFSAVEALGVASARSARGTSFTEGVFRPGTVGENRTQNLFGADSPAQVLSIIQQVGDGLNELQESGGGITLPFVGGNSFTGFETSESGRSIRRNSAPGGGQTELINVNVGGQTQVLDASNIPAELRQEIQRIWQEQFQETER